MSVAPEAMQLAKLMVHEESRVRADAVDWHLLNSVVHCERGEVAAKAEVAKRTRVENCMVAVLVPVYGNLWKVVSVVVKQVIV